MALVKWIPFKDLLSFQERMSHIFDEAFSRFAGIIDPSRCAWSPHADIYETVDNIVLKVELPGVLPDNVVVEVKENCLSLKGERTLNRELKNENYHRMECSYGTFHRTFTLPAVVDKNGIKANFKEGVLEITVPKAEEKAAKHIKVEPE
ncbi:MAG: Hsp20/alpha crystallin family protein [Deltaproteobacteria bacterium]|nr:Hsp20/alpha crystallin family protein [Deltaproteobacteria bacterium]